jgi:thiol-disulfide isomerase/thioredoxin
MKTMFYDKYKVFFTFHFLLTSFFSFAQDSICISGQLHGNTRFAKVVIKKFNIGSFDIAAVPIKEGRFQITAPANLEAGVYRFQYSQSSLSEYVDIIIDGKEKEIRFTLNLNEPIENRKPVFTQSEQNKKWYHYKAQQDRQLQKIGALQNALALYPDGKDKIIGQLQKAIAKEQKNQSNSYLKFIKDNQGTWVGNMVANKPVYFTNPKDDWRLQDFKKKERFWDNINTTNPELINSPLYTEHILEYLKYYMNPEMQFGEDEMNEGFKKSVDTIMQRFGGNPKTQEFALKYLQLGFKEIGNEKVLQYIDEKYQQEIEQCNDSSIDKEAFEKRMAGYAATKEGNLAPDFQLNMESRNEKVSSLFNLQSEKTLIVFWSSSCPHCMEEMPKLNDWAATQTSLTVIAVSLDMNSSVHNESIKNFPNMIHSCDYKGWDTEAATKYYIAATPTFIILDKDKKVIGKYSNIERIKK